MSTATLVQVPTRPGMTLRANTREENPVTLYYRRSREDILSLGMLTPEQLEPWKLGQPKGKRDRDGHRVWVCRQAVVRAGELSLRFEVTLLGKLISQIEHLPGVVEAIALAREEESQHAEKIRQWNETHSSGGLETAPRLVASVHLIDGSCTVQ